MTSVNHKPVILQNSGIAKKQQQIIKTSSLSITKKKSLPADVISFQKDFKQNESAFKLPETILAFLGKNKSKKGKKKKADKSKQNSIRQQRKTLQAIIKRHFSKATGIEEYASIRPELVQWVKLTESGERYRHSLNCESTALELATRAGVDPTKAAIASILHDNAKHYSDRELQNIIQKQGLSISEEDFNSSSRLHAIVGEWVVKEKLGITDSEILLGIRNHNILRDNATLFEKVIYLADKSEPFLRGRKLHDNVIELLNLDNDLDKAIKLIN